MHLAEHTSLSPVVEACLPRLGECEGTMKWTRVGSSGAPEVDTATSRYLSPAISWWPRNARVGSGRSPCLLRPVWVQSCCSSGVADSRHGAVGSAPRHPADPAVRVALAVALEQGDTARVPSATEAPSSAAVSPCWTAPPTSDRPAHL